jgi:hypothetical protein
MIVPKQPFVSHSGSWSRPPQATAGPYTHQLCRTYVCSATTWSRIPVCLVERTPTRLCVRKTKLRVVGGMSTCRADWLLGLPLYHILRHVASTFKRLATTTTHFDLINFNQHRRSKFPGHVTAHDSVHDPYNDCRMVNHSTPISREWQEITQLLPTLFSRASNAIRTRLQYIGSLRSYATRVSVQLLDIMQDT